MKAISSPTSTAVGRDRLFPDRRHARTSGAGNRRNQLSQRFSPYHRKGFTGILGMEHGKSKPGKEGEDALIQSYVDADNF
jgi:hydroxypyruvate isomerase